MPDPTPEAGKTIEREHLLSVCRLGQGAACCRYIIVSGSGIECAKGSPLQAGLDARTKMTAKGDNCSGPPDFKVADNA